MSSVFESIILGIIQGITEFLPVSSTAHLIVFPWFLNWNGVVDTLTFDIALHAGTLLALVIFFWKSWRELLMERQRLLGKILLGSIPAGIAGLLLNDIVAHDLRNPIIICSMLILVGFIMLAAEKMFTFKTINEMGIRDVLFIGIAQAVAIIPGVSRSGITISAALFRGYDREEAARFSFLLATPVLAGATVLHTGELWKNPELYDYKIFLIGFITSSITGFLAIKFLLNFLRRHTMNLFVYYRFALSIVIISGIWLKG